MRSILITGCSTGIGYETALYLKGKGYKVFATARKTEDITRLEAEGLTVIELDYSRSESVNDCVNELILRTNNEIYAVFNNGGYGQVGAVEDLRRDVLEQQFATNVFGWIELTNRLIPLMRHVGEGRIIFNSSVLGLVALPYRGAYNATKYAIEGFADTLRLELRNTDIEVSLIEPGPIESNFMKNSLFKMKKNIAIESSFHRDNYKRELARLEKTGHAVPFTLPAEAVLKKVIHALESTKPQAHYYVTFPTYLLGYLKRLLPAKWLDKALIIAGGKNT